ncbi:MAG: hypothetical protein MUF72_14635 [Elainella sp. Prado103]|nr:hypothetical protein [Elainella sp. Prado103]
MEISRPNQRELTVEEQQELEKLKQIVERAIADGILTKAEREQIVTAIRADGQVTYEELIFVQTFLREKVAKGELILDYSV